MKTYELELNIPALPQLVEEAKAEEIILTNHSKPVAKIVAIEESPRRARKAGFLKGWWVAPDFDEPLECFREYMK